MENYNSVVLEDRKKRERLRERLLLTCWQLLLS